MELSKVRVDGRRGSANAAKIQNNDQVKDRNQKHLQEPRKKPTDRDHPKVGHHTGSKRYRIGHQQRWNDHLPATQRIRQESPQMRPSDRPCQRHRSQDSLLPGSKIQITLCNSDHVTYAQHLQHDRGQHRSGDRDQRVVEATKF